jgi:hypothetical protein
MTRQRNMLLDMPRKEALLAPDFLADQPQQLTRQNISWTARPGRGGPRNRTIDNFDVHLRWLIYGIG